MSDEKNQSRYTAVNIAKTGSVNIWEASGAIAPLRVCQNPKPILSLSRL
jgi:hypothetical protein